jgi:hypothetical protein
MVIEISIVSLGFETLLQKHTLYQNCVSWKHQAIEVSLYENHGSELM